MFCCVKKFFILLLIITITLFSFCACSKKNRNDDVSKENSIKDKNVGSFDVNVKANEDFFEWDGNIITAITDEASKHNSLLIPKRCEGFAGAIFIDTDISHVAFESEEDITLDFAFTGAKNIISVKLPANLTVISSMSFQKCEKLEEIIIPSSVTTLENYAFSACNNLKNVTFLGESIGVIGENCFEDCKKLTTISIPNGVNTIGKYAFFECSSLASVKFSDSINTIEKFAFGNTSISEVHFPETIELNSMDDSAFGTNAYTTTVYIVKGSWCDSNQQVWNIGFGAIEYE